MKLTAEQRQLLGDLTRVDSYVTLDLEKYWPLVYLDLVQIADDVADGLHAPNQRRISVTEKGLAVASSLHINYRGSKP